MTSAEAAPGNASANATTASDGKTPIDRLNMTFSLCFGVLPGSNDPHFE
jgi:hypothetical protein